MAGHSTGTGEYSTLQLVNSLIDNGDFGHATSDIQLIETHISWVLLTGEFAYKIKKPVDLGFLNFSTLDARHEYCQLELELNRQFAPELYLDVVSIGGNPGKPVIGATPALEWAVRMKQFPAESRLDRQIELDRISADDMRTFGDSLARLHDRSPTLTGSENPYGSVESIAGPVEDNFVTLARYRPDSDMHCRLSALADWCRQEITRLAPTIRNRQASGRVRECHGDLHLENLVRLEDRIAPFDCLEFDESLRCIDVMNEVAFLLMDTLRIGRQDLGFSFLNRYLEVSGDYPGTAVLNFYSVYRSLVRAKIAALRDLQQRGDGNNADVIRYVELAERLAGHNEPCLVICRGLSGSGKTHLSSRLLSIMPAIRIRSDIERKRLHQVGELESSDSEIGTGLYEPTVTSKTYETLARFATIALTAGYDVIVDATFLRRADRSLLKSVAQSCTARFAILDCTADNRVLAERIEKRHSAGNDASEAGLAVLDWQRSNREPLTQDEQRHTLTVDTGRHSVAREIMSQIRDIAAEA